MLQPMAAFCCSRVGQSSQEILTDYNNEVMIKNVREKKRICLQTSDDKNLENLELNGNLIQKRS